MVRKVFGALVVLLLCVGFTFAEDVKGKVKKIDFDKGTITVTVGDKDMDYAVPKDAKVLDADGKAVEGGLKGSPFKNPGAEVTITTEKKDNKDTVTAIKVTKK